MPKNTTKKYKNCSNPLCTCVNPQPIKNFHKNSLGCHSRCKTCRCAVENKRNEIKRATDQKPRRKPTEQTSGTLKEYKYQYYLKNKDRLDEKSRKWRAQNKEKVEEKNRRWHKQHPEKNTEYAQRRRALCKNTKINDFTADQWRDLKRLYDYHCAYCWVVFEKLEPDHIIPLTREGQHTLSNIVPACRHCNATKNNKTPEEAGMSYVNLHITNTL